MNIRVAIIDSGFEDAIDAVARSQFVFENDQVLQKPATPDIHTHGSALADTVRKLAPECELINAQVFGQNMAASPIAIAAAIDWSVEMGARLINMSFGLPDDRDVLRLACERAIKNGALLFAAAPARGGPVYPSAYPGVLRISGDARLKFGEVSILEAGRQADYGGCVRPGGASFAVAQIVGLSARYLQSDEDAGIEKLCTYLNSINRYDRPERKTIEEV